jgi:hypothetical protein
MGSMKRVTLGCEGRFGGTVWDALRHAGVSDLSMTNRASGCTFEFTTDDPAAILDRSVIQVCNVQASVTDA